MSKDDIQYTMVQNALCVTILRYSNTSRSYDTVESIEVVREAVKMSVQVRMRKKKSMAKKSTSRVHLSA